MEARERTKTVADCTIGDSDIEQFWRYSGRPVFSHSIYEAMCFGERKM
jgi:hypothetical protein